MRKKKKQCGAQHEHCNTQLKKKKEQEKGTRKRNASKRYPALIVCFSSTQFFMQGRAIYMAAKDLTEQGLNNNAGRATLATVRATANASLERTDAQQQGEKNE